MMRWIISFVLITLLLSGCSGMTASLALGDNYGYDSWYDIPDRYSPNYFDNYCPRNYYFGPMDCRDCHYFW